MAIKSQIYTVSSLKLAQKIKKQDPVSIMQKTDLTNFSPFLVWKWVSHMVVITGGSQKKSSFVLGHFRHGDNQPTEQTAGFYPSASLFSSSEKVVFCKKKAPVHSCRVRVMELWSTLCYMFFILRIADNLVSPPTMHLSALSIPHHGIPSTRLSPNHLENFETNSHLCLCPY